MKDETMSRAKQTRKNKPGSQSRKSNPHHGTTKSGEHRSAPKRTDHGHKKSDESHKKSSNSENHKNKSGAKLLNPNRRNGFFLHGRNSIEAALKNPDRDSSRLIGTERALDAARDLIKLRPDLKVEMVDIETLNASTSSESPHQGLMLDVLPLPSPHLDSVSPLEGRKNIVLILDQVTDPHNVGACIRSAAALGARALITQDRNSPMESGVLARTSSGGIETCPWIRVTNLAHALDELKDMGYWSVGLDGATDMSIRDVKAGDNIAIVMGSEGKGLRPLVRKSCDLIAKIPMSGKVESLNVSNAAAIAMYELGD